MWHLYSLSSLPWLVAEDLIEILLPNEKIGRDRNRWQIDNFHDALADTELFDLGLKGQSLLGKGKRLQMIMCMLD